MSDRLRDLRRPEHDGELRMERLSRVTVTGFIALLVIFACESASGSAKTAAALTNRQLQIIAQQPFDKRAMMGKRVELGRHHGTPVIAEFPCSDVCPQATRRIIRYEIDLTRCDRIDGRLLTTLVPRGIGVQRRLFCVPSAIADNGSIGPFRLASGRCPRGSEPRRASQADNFCVVPTSRRTVAAENAQAAARRDPGGDYGPNTCKSGFVWREAAPGDLVCVPPQRRDQVRQENQSAFTWPPANGRW
jgi:hypothetical protein